MNRTEACGVSSKVNLGKALGKLEVLDPEDEDYTKTNKSSPLKFNSQSAEFATKGPVSLQNGKLQVLGPEEEVVTPPCDAASRPGSAAGRQGSDGRKGYIPTKQIPLCTVKPVALSCNVPENSGTPSIQTDKSEEGQMQKTSPTPTNPDEKGTTGPQSLTIHNDFKGCLEESSDEDESDDDGRAPMELLAEFISAVMEEDYEVAHKLCQMILLYEPDNPEAKEFSPLIEEMLKIELGQSTDDEDSDDSDEETDEDTCGDEDEDDDEESHCTAKNTS
ncbi:glutamate-rich protein 2 isoform 1-T1 [Anomaloglossus baeobatrachus]|uniref:glutamate-rich protein 2 isoform X1 n=1 Tax=Anomaloglossus baeobatrachus TaxID=238106 RepID=UPI003F4F9B90